MKSLTPEIDEIRKLYKEDKAISFLGLDKIGIVEKSVIKEILDKYYKKYMELYERGLINDRFQMDILEIKNYLLGEQLK